MKQLPDGTCEQLVVPANIPKPETWVTERFAVQYKKIFTDTRATPYAHGTAGPRDQPNTGTAAGSSGAGGGTSTTGAGAPGGNGANRTTSAPPGSRNIFLRGGRQPGVWTDVDWKQGALAAPIQVWTYDDYDNRDFAYSPHHNQHPFYRKLTTEIVMPPIPAQGQTESEISWIRPTNRAHAHHRLNCLEIMCLRVYNVTPPSAVRRAFRDDHVGGNSAILWGYALIAQIQSFFDRAEDPRYTGQRLMTECIYENEVCYASFSFKSETTGTWSEQLDTDTTPQDVVSDVLIVRKSPDASKPKEYIAVVRENMPLNAFVPTVRMTPILYMIMYSGANYSAHLACEMFYRTGLVWNATSETWITTTDKRIPFFYSIVGVS